MTLEEKKQELLDADIVEPQLSEALSAWQKEQENIDLKAKEQEDYLNEIITIGKSEARDLGFEGVGKGIGTFKIKRSDYFNNPNVRAEAKALNTYLKSEEFNQVDNDKVYQQGLKNYFAVDEIEDYETELQKGDKSKEASALRKFYNQKRLEGFEAYEVQQMPEYKKLRRQKDKKFVS